MIIHRIILLEQEQVQMQMVQEAKIIRILGLTLQVLTIIIIVTMQGHLAVITAEIITAGVIIVVVEDHLEAEDHLAAEGHLAAEDTVVVTMGAAAEEDNLLL